MKPEFITSIMTRDVVCVSPDQKIIDVKHIYEKDKFHHHIPVTEDGKLKGMVSLVDFMYNINGAGIADSAAVYNELMVKDIMTPNPFYLSTNATIEDVAKVLAKGNYRAVPIIENDRVVGIVSTADIIAFFLKQAN